MISPFSKRNNTGATQNNVSVDAYFTDPRIALEFPSLTSTLIGTQTISVPAGSTEIIMPWTVPVGRNSWGELHWCVGVVIKHADDMPLTTVINRSSNIACKNFETRELLSGSILTVSAINFLSVAAELQVNTGNFPLPPGFRYEILTNQIKRDKQATAGTIRKGKLLKTTGLLLEPGETIQIPVKVYFDGAPGGNKDFTLKGDIIPLIAGKRETFSNGYTFQLKFKN